MPRVEISVKTASGQTIVLSPEDRIERAITTECNSKRCASRHNDQRQEVTVVDGVLPEGNQWLMLVVSEQSPNYLPQGIHLCSPQCCKDFLVYDYSAPATHNPVSVQPDLPESHIPGFSGPFSVEQTEANPSDLPAGLYAEQYPILQADGDPGDEHQ